MSIAENTLQKQAAGRAYGRPAAEPDMRLTAVGPGTPMGELLRRYWHPIGMVGDATTTPRRVRVLGEDLILFRDGQGRPGLLTEHCAHRGTSLYYGKVEDEGIRCCYHGWKFDVEGRCVDQPCEPEGGRARHKVFQPWYPVQELYGLIWAYLGPAERQPVLPRYAALENLAAGEFIEANDRSIGGGGPVIIDCNWLQHYENLVDPFHVVVLHSTFSGTQFVDAMAVMPDVSWDESEMGVRTTSRRALPDGKVFLRISEAAIPTLRVIPSPRVGQYGPVESIGWILPIDDTSFRIYVAGRVTKAGELSGMRSRQNGKLWEELTEEEHQQFPGDYEAMVSQRKIAVRSEEHLGTTDRGIVMLRRRLLREIEAVEAGHDPVGVSFDPDAPPVHFTAGNFLVEPEAANR